MRNTLIMKDEGIRAGYNTDYQAALDSLEAAMGGREAPEAASPLMEKLVLILGAGGVARAIAFGCERAGASITIANRHDERSTRSAGRKRSAARPSTGGQRAQHPGPDHHQLHAGRHAPGTVDDTPVPPATFNKPEMIAFDTVYHPENTMFLKLAREREAKTVSGVDMFIRQASTQFKLYTGQDAPEGVMLSTVVCRKLGPIRE